MQEKDLDKLSELAKSLRSYSKKIKLIALLDKAKSEYNSNKFSDCEKSCRKALGLDAQNATALRGLGCVSQAGGDYSNAEKYYKKALKFSTQKEIEYTLLGNLYYMQDDLEKALEYFNLAIENNDDYEKAYDCRNQAMLEKHLKIVDLQDSLIRQKIF